MGIPQYPIVSFIDEVEFEYDVASGCFYLADRQDGRALIGRGYSGKGSARNDPEREREHATGPIPRGVWRVSTSLHHSRLGPVVFPLSYGETAKEASEPFKRSGFFIHGDNAAGNGTASTGCIILPRHVREFISALQRFGVSRLRVV